MGEYTWPLMPLNSTSIHFLWSWIDVLWLMSMQFNRLNTIYQWLLLRHKLSFLTVASVCPKTITDIFNNPLLLGVNLKEVLLGLIVGSWRPPLFWREREGEWIWRRRELEGNLGGLKEGESVVGIIVWENNLLSKNHTNGHIVNRPVKTMEKKNLYDSSEEKLNIYQTMGPRCTCNIP